MLAYEKHLTRLGIESTREKHQNLRLVHKSIAQNMKRNYFALFSSNWTARN